MPDKEELRLAICQEPEALSRAVLPGLDRPLEELPGSERVQVRPGTEVADAYLEDATGSISGFSSMLDELGQLQKSRA